jgi:lysophospholipase L1-like esterase
VNNLYLFLLFINTLQSEYQSVSFVMNPVIPNYVEELPPKIILFGDSITQVSPSSSSSSSSFSSVSTGMFEFTLHLHQCCHFHRSPQFSLCSGGFGQRIAEVYQRRADVVNRGFSGWTTIWASTRLENVFPPLPPSQPIPEHQRPLFVTIFLGANDAAVKGTTYQHVPLPIFREKLKEIANYFRINLQPKAVIFITPPLVDGPRWQRER